MSQSIPLRVRMKSQVITLHPIRYEIQFTFILSIGIKRNTMKAQLTFNLPEDHSDFMHAVHGSDAVHVLNEMSQLMRTILKYEDHTPEVYEVVEKLREQLFQLCAENKVDLL